MGGGTLVGVRYFRMLTKLGLAVTRNNGKYAIGVGVQDPGYTGRGSGSQNDELTKWKPILADFDSVSVRGPRSVELLADIGVTAQVTGDPALILPRPEVPVEDGLIGGVNLGYGDDLWGDMTRWGGWPSKSRWRCVNWRAGGAIDSSAS